jgi:hypothetical protein
MQVGPDIELFVLLWLLRKLLEDVVGDDDGECVAILLLANDQTNTTLVDLTVSIVFELATKSRQSAIAHELWSLLDNRLRLSRRQRILQNAFRACLGRSTAHWVRWVGQKGTKYRLL